MTAMTIKLLTALSAFLISGAAQAQADWSPVAWMAGCWAGDFGEAGTTEQWMAPAGESMLGMSRTVKKGRTVEHEFLQIRPDASGRLAYIAKPHNQAEASFPLKSAGEKSVVFENLEHDFPQRILYRAEGADRLMARIEGERNGKLRGVDFPMRRVACG